jgi:hypothetical protein
MAASEQFSVIADTSNSPHPTSRLGPNLMSTAGPVPVDIPIGEGRGYRPGLRVGE